MPNRSDTPTGTPPGSTPRRELLRVVYLALDIPYPLGEADRLPYLICRSKRASLALEAIAKLLDDPEAGDYEAVVITAMLRAQLADFPPDTYAHNSLSS